VLAHQIHVDNTGDPKVNIMSSRIMEIVEDYLGKLLPDEYRDFLPDQDNLDPKAAPVSLSGAAFFVSA
jgi:hypothetical protein